LLPRETDWALEQACQSSAQELERLGSPRDGRTSPQCDNAVPQGDVCPYRRRVNGKAAQVINALGWPGMSNVYRVDFRVPEGTAAGTATLGLSVAWINGPEVNIPVR